MTALAKRKSRSNSPARKMATQPAAHARLITREELVFLTDKEGEDDYRQHWLETTLDGPTRCRLQNAEKTLHGLSTVTRLLRLDAASAEHAKVTGKSYTPLDGNMRGGLLRAQDVLIDCLDEFFDELHDLHKAQP